MSKGFTSAVVSLIVVFVTGVACGKIQDRSPEAEAMSVTVAPGESDMGSVDDNVDATVDVHGGEIGSDTIVAYEGQSVEATVDNQKAKRALVVGLGEQLDPHWAKINGDKDVPYVTQMLQSVGYTDIRTLVNMRATKAGIVAAFKSLTNSCRAGDIVYVHFSGHGQQVTDVNKDEDEGLDESWIPYDAYRNYCDNDKGEKHLIDDEINVLLTQVKDRIGDDGKLLVVVDACHSGDSSRGGNDAPVRGVRNLFVIPEVDSTRTEQAPETWITLSACKPIQLNQEMKEPTVGKLTYALYNAVINHHVEMSAIEDFMNQYRGPLPQTPMLTGDTIKYKLNQFF